MINRLVINKLRRGVGTAALVVLSTVGLVACNNSSADIDPEDAVNIRFVNATGEKIDRLWLGVGPEGGSTFQTRYTNIDDGETTDYQTVEPVIENYQAANFTISGSGRFIARQMNPHEVLGVDSLSAGSFYTFTLVLDGDGDNASLSQVTLDEG